MTDFLASKCAENSMVVRFNGGAQAGHTVLCPDGRRHVFSHFGAASFLDCPTYLSQFFIVNPLVFVKELLVLKYLKVTPTVLLDCKAFVTTPFDMLINQAIESRRQLSRHGSCGLGINETVNRSLRGPTFAVRAGDILDAKHLRARLHDLASTWFPKRLSEHGLDRSDSMAASFIDRQESIIEHFIDDCKTLLDHTEIVSDYPQCRRVIFEGAQGLMLDEDRIDQWPHVTRSKTGLPNVLYLARKMELESLQVTYITRSYLTRHGAGTLNGECDLAFPDNTNVTNSFQGTLRFAPLDVDALRNSIAMDFGYARLHWADLQGDLAITCADQLTPPAMKTELPIAYVSCGATRNDVEVLSQYSQRLTASRMTTGDQRLEAVRTN
jgi:adenylosuccinate synthase